MFRIEITADSADDFASKIAALAEKLGGVNTETTDADPAPRRTRRTKAEMEAAKAAETPADTKGEPAAETATEPEQPVTKSAEAKGETPAEEPAKGDDKWAGYDTGKAREFIITKYLNVHFDDAGSRANAFKAIVSKFDYPNLTTVPADKLPEVLDHVAGLIAEKEAA